MSDTKHRQRLTDEQLADVLDQIRSNGDDGWVHGILATFRHLGVDLSVEPEKKIAPWDYAIPTDQWSEIASACGACGSDLMRVNHMLDWMNKGPSSYDSIAEVDS